VQNRYLFGPLLSGGLAYPVYQMSRFSRDSKYRLRDFRKRTTKNDGCNQVYINKSIDHEYMPVHPFAYEVEMLETLKPSPEKCTSVDAYWNLKTDIAFLQVATITVFDHKVVGLYVRWEKTKKEFLNLVAIVDAPYVTRESFENVMCRFINPCISPSEKNRKRYGRKLKYIGKTC